MPFQSSLRLPLVAIAFAVGCGAAAEPLDEQSEEELSARSKVSSADVSILLPLPKASANESIAATTTGKGGDELVPATALKITGAPGQAVLNEAFYWNHGPTRIVKLEDERPLLRLTAVRLDPCGRVAPTDPESRCVPEVRLVFQPVLANADGKFEAADGAIHAFYRVSLDELKSFTKTMLEARKASGESSTTLGVHPTLAKEGLTGPFAATLFGAVKKFCGGANLERVTFLQRTKAREPVWVFGITAVVNKVAEVRQIASTTSTVQALEGPGFNSPMHLTNVSTSGGTPTETGTTDKISALLDSRTTSLDDKVHALNASFRIDNPTIHSPETMSCVECHVASGARKAALAADPRLTEAAIDPSNVFSPPSSARHVASKDVGNLHSFSYKGVDIGISDRAANDSAAVAAKLNAILF